MTKEELLHAIQTGVTVYWSSLNYIVKFDFDGDLIIKSNFSHGQELFTDSQLNECFTK